MTKFQQLVNQKTKEWQKKLKNDPEYQTLLKKYREADKKECWEAEQNLLGFFSLLLEVDKRVNPRLYKKDKNIK